MSVPMYNSTVLYLGMSVLSRATLKVGKECYIRWFDFCYCTYYTIFLKGEIARKFHGKELGLKTSDHITLRL